jgi:hypothetical protein
MAHTLTATQQQEKINIILDAIHGGLYNVVTGDVNILIWDMRSALKILGFDVTIAEHHEAVTEIIHDWQWARQNPNQQ